MTRSAATYIKYMTATSCSIPLHLQRASIKLSLLLHNLKVLLRKFHIFGHSYLVQLRTYLIVLVRLLKANTCFTCATWNYV